MFSAELDSGTLLMLFLLAFAEWCHLPLGGCVSFGLLKVSVANSFVTCRSPAWADLCACCSVSQQGPTLGFVQEITKSLLSSAFHIP